MNRSELESLLSRIYLETDSRFVDICNTSENGKICLYDPPIFGIAAAFDPLYERLKLDEVVGPWHKSPAEWLRGAKSVISVFFPASEFVRKSNRGDKDEPSDGWLYARMEGQNFINEFTRKLCEEINALGIEVCAPGLEGDFASVIDGKLPGSEREHVFASNWSERHTAYIAGLGTFGLSKGIITQKGMAGRFAIVIISEELEPDKRLYTDIYEYCTMCGACIKRCPAHAITFEGGKDHKLCSENVNQTSKTHAPRYGCGKCQTAVPCEFELPKK